MVNPDLLEKDIEKSGIFSFSRSAGPGGQNVNKVNSRVTLTVPVEEIYSLSIEEKARLRIKLAGRINTKDELFISVQQERSQLRNREIAVENLTLLICDSLRRNKKRKKTKPSRAAVEARIADKKRRAGIKKNRNFSNGDY